MFSRIPFLFTFFQILRIHISRRGPKTAGIPIYVVSTYLQSTDSVKKKKRMAIETVRGFAAKYIFEYFIK